MRVLFVIPGDINTPTGGYRYDRAIIDMMRQDGVAIDLVSLPGPYPAVSADDIARGTELLQSTFPADCAVVDGLAGGAAPTLIKTLAERMPVMALIHHPLCLETGLEAEEAARLRQSEKDGLAHMKGVITSGPATARIVCELFGFPEDRIKPVIPGVLRGALSTAWGGGTLHLLSVGSLTPRKGHDILIEALSDLTALDWTLDVVGSAEFDPPHAAMLKNLVHRHDLSDRISFHGALSQSALEAFYARSHIFALASHYEGYGMVFSEAIVRGLPIIATTGGAIPDTVPPSCGTLVAPGDIAALSQTLQQWLSDPALVAEKRQNALAVADHFPDWRQSARLFRDFLEQFSGAPE